LQSVFNLSHCSHLLVEQGLELRDAVLEGAKRRMSPVLLTATIAAFGLVPFLFAEGPGAEIQRPLAVVVIGGLVTATVLTLVLLPLLYDRFALPRHRTSPGRAALPEDQIGAPAGPQSGAAG
jgi:cobalt-zinc-cadmium resistance protein CzcA